MAAMLDALDVERDNRVLEIGTGSGYNAALLSEYLDSGNVSTIDIDTGLVALARDRLAAAGYHPTVAVADGLDGYPANAPYDRIMSTCQTWRLPDAWIRQVRPGGRIVAVLPSPSWAWTCMRTALPRDVSIRSTSCSWSCAASA